MHRTSTRYSLILLLMAALAPGAAANVGADLYRQYCAVCHGQHGAGDGPVGDALRVKPADLTQLSRKYSGKFPELRVMNFIRGDAEVTAHGKRQMPVWGRVFLEDSGGRPEIVQMRIYAVLKYVEQLQVK
jgi:mono/diheme cytochrome c family protein